MNILFISAVMPYPLYSGGQIRIFNLLKRLSVNHNITLLTFIRNHQEEQYVQKVNFVRTRQIFRGSRLQLPYIIQFLGGSSLLLASYNNKKMKHAIEHEILANRYDLVHIEPFYVAPALPEVNLPLVVASHNVEYEVYQVFAQSLGFPLRQVMEIEASRIKNEEIRTLKSATKIIAVSESDRQVIAHHVPQNKIEIVANGVDLEQFVYRRPEKTDHPIFLFVGDFKWMPNRELLSRLLSQIWPSIQSHIPGSKLRIIGRSLPKSARDFTDTSVEFLQNVPNIAQEYHNAHILLAPIAISGGSKYKILEAMAAGLPIVSSEEALVGIGGKSGTHALVARTPQEFAQSAKLLLQNEIMASEIASTARKLIESRYSWDVIARRQSSVWESTRK